MLNVCYSAQYFAQTHTNSMEKLSAVAAALQALPNIRFHAPQLLKKSVFAELHDPHYVQAVFRGSPVKLATMAGFKPWNIQLRDAIRCIHGGQLLAAKLAWKHGIAANIAQGFHHAKYEYGGSFCTFNGLALVAQQFPHKRIFVLDCDQHGGDGTAEFARNLDNLYNFSIHGLACGCVQHERSETRHIHPVHGNFAQYILALHEAFRRAQDWGADLIIYQAGMDCHQDDPFGSTWFTRALLQKREEMVFGLAKQSQIPLLFVLAGGYQALEPLVDLHVMTFQSALKVYGNYELPQENRRIIMPDPLL